MEALYGWAPWICWTDIWLQVKVKAKAKVMNKGSYMWVSQTAKEKAREHKLVAVLVKAKFLLKVHELLQALCCQAWFQTVLAILAVGSHANQTQSQSPPNPHHHLYCQCPPKKHKSAAYSRCVVYHEEDYDTGIVRNRPEPSRTDAKLCESKTSTWHLVPSTMNCQVLTLWAWAVEESCHILGWAAGSIAGCHAQWLSHAMMVQFQWRTAPLHENPQHPEGHPGPPRCMLAICIGGCQKLDFWGNMGQLKVTDWAPSHLLW